MTRELRNIAGIKQSTCAYCGVGCGVDIHQQVSPESTQIEAVSLQGSQDHPANFGRLCVKGENLLATTSLDDRLLYPHIKNERVQWSQAIEHVANKFNDIIAEHGPESVAFYVSGQLLTEDYYLANKLMKGYIGSGNIETNSRLCMSSAVAAYKRAFGEDVVPCSYQDLEQTDLIVLVGSNAAWTHPVLFQRMQHAKQINPDMKLVCIDPRRTQTAAMADLHLPLKPGTDAVFFNGLLAFIAAANACDSHFIQQHSEGFEQALASASSYTPERVSQICELGIEQLLDCYQWFIESKRAISFYSMGINQSSTGVDKCNAIINCHLASGKIGRPGCGPFSITGQPNAMGGREVGGLANQLTAHMDIENPQHRQSVQTFWQSPTMTQQPGLKAVDMFDAIKDNKIKAVWIMATNPLVSMPNRQVIEDALDKCELVVVSDCVATNDTISKADVTLPAAGWLEKDGMVTNSERLMSRQRGIIAAPGESKSDWQIIAEVAKAMGFSGFDYASVADVFREYAKLTGYENNGERLLDISALAQLSDAEYDLLKPVQWPVNANYPNGCAQVFSDNKFSTPSGKARFLPITPQLPQAKIDNDYPFILNSGRLRDQWHTMTRTSRADALNEHSPQPLIHIHPKDAAKQQIKEGDYVEATSRFGKLIMAANITEDVRSGEVFAPIHWSRTFASHGCVSALYSSVNDPISGQPELKQTPVAIAPKAYETYVTIVAHSLTEETDNLLSKMIPERLSADDFWLNYPNRALQQWQLAMNRVPEDLLSWCKTFLPGQYRWLQQIDNNTNKTTLLAFNQESLVFYGQFSALPQEFNRPWLQHCFDQEQLNSDDRSALLTSMVSTEFCLGRQVCSCFQVHQQTIVDAIEQGAASVTELTETLGCGGKCGSCKPELAALLEHHNKAPQQSLIIPSKEVA
ncbi:nitrate reductase [Thalassotalea litorea]|uniref:Nitrate reductase n=1 Tax=Thalassotalea litorea TaxID=2020715 RepID=A0A5R9ILZ5_9GAMM|nr:nitrate reductase [Thalassotalea litorea]TLU64271.1 nitrate reductase [Thalassotalea litorea]